MMFDEHKNFKSIHKMINDFLVLNDTFIFLGKNQDNSKISLINFDNQGKKSVAYVIDDTLSKSEQYANRDIIIESIINSYKIPNYLYADIRLELKEKNFLSKKAGVKAQYLDEKTKLYFILYKFYRFKEMLKRHSKEVLLNHYVTIEYNEILDKIWKKNKIGTDYFILTDLHALVSIYEKENGIEIEKNYSLFGDRMILKYLDNYFSKFVVFSYDEDIAKNFIFNYYRSEITSSDMVSRFVDGLIYTFGVVQNLNIRIKNSYHFNIKSYIFLPMLLKKKLKYISFGEKFDKMVSDKKNYLNFMFLLEILEPAKYVTDRKAVINHVSVIELLLTHLPKNELDTISRQFIGNILELDKNKNYSKKELNIIYSYRSKVIHGDYTEMNKEIKKISKLKEYGLSVIEKNDLKYLDLNEMLEMKIYKRTLKIVKMLITKFIKNPEYINGLKNKRFDLLKVIRMFIW